MNTRIATNGKALARSESGIAIVVAIMMIILVCAVVSIFIEMTLSNSESHKLDASQAQSLPWAEAAISDIKTKLEMRVTGQHLAYPSPNKLKHEIAVLTNGPVPLCAGDNSDTSGCYGKTNYYSNTRLRANDPLAAYKWGFRIKIQDPTKPIGNYIWGWYQIKHQNAYNWIHSAYTPSTDNSADGGQLSVTVRGWMETSQPAPRMVHYVLQQHQLTKYAILTDEHLDQGDATITGAVHSNDTDLPGGQPDNNVVSFDSIDHVYNLIDTISDHDNGYYCGDPMEVVVCKIKQVPIAPAGRIPIYHVRLKANLCMEYWPAYYQSTHYQNQSNGDATPVIDDRYPDMPIGGTPNITTLCTSAYFPNGTYHMPNSAGGPVVMFPTTVVVEGNSNRAVTIVARSKVASTPASILITKPTSGPVAESTYFGGLDGGINDQTGRPWGEQRAVGLIAQDSVYVPQWAMPPVGETFTLDHVGIVAHGGNLSLGPTLQAAAGSKDPCDPFLNAPAAYGDIEIKGVVMSRKSPLLQYSSSATDNPCRVGFNKRTYTWYPSMFYDPPSFFPTDGGWTTASVNIDYGMDRRDGCSPAPGIIFIPHFDDCDPSWYAG